MRARGEVHEDVHLACVANPSLEGSAHGPGRLRAKLECAYGRTDPEVELAG